MRVGNGCLIRLNPTVELAARNLDIADFEQGVGNRRPINLWIKDDERTIEVIECEIFLFLTFVINTEEIQGSALEGAIVSTGGQIKRAL